MRETLIWGAAALLAVALIGSEAARMTLVLGAVKFAVAVMP